MSIVVTAPAWFAAVLAEVDQTFLETGRDTPAWPDPRPFGQPPAEAEYSRYTDPGKYAILDARLTAWQQVLTTRHRHHARRRLPQWPTPDVQHDSIQQLIPTAPGALALLVATAPPTGRGSASTSLLPTLTTEMRSSPGCPSADATPATTDPPTYSPSSTTPSAPSPPAASSTPSAPRIHYPRSHRLGQLRRPRPSLASTPSNPRLPTSDGGPDAPGNRLLTPDRLGSPASGSALACSPSDSLPHGQQADGVSMSSHFGL